MANPTKNVLPPFVTIGEQKEDLCFAFTGNDWFDTRELECFLCNKGFETQHVTLERAEESECFKRCVLWFLVKRFSYLKTVDATFFGLLNNMFAYQKGESLSSWLKRFKYFNVELFLDFCVLHAIHCNCAPGLHGVTPDTMNSKVMACFMACYEQQGPGFDSKDVLKLYLFKLLHLLSQEKVQEQRRFLVTKFKSAAAAAAVRKPVLPYYGTPTYYTRPVKGPFRVDYKGQSSLRRLYGRKPFSEYYYCPCSLDGSLCGLEVFFKSQ
jgi:hypothetical protein